jgi:periplasmic protein TonB
MQKDMILKSSLLDILFENKNKNYGAYLLRKTYPLRLKKALFLTVLFAVAIIFLLSSFKEKNKPVIKQPFLPKPTTLPQAPVEKPKPKEQPKSTKQNTPVKIIPAISANLLLVDKPDDAIIPDPKAEGSANGNTVDPGAGTSGFGGTGTGGLDADTTTKTPPVVIPPKENVVNTIDIQTIVDVEASYPGGNKALGEYLQEKLGKEVVEDGVAKKVTIHFVIETDGSLTAIKANAADDPSFSAKTERAFAKMKKWLPAKIKNIAVRTYMEIPVTILPGEE